MSTESEINKNDQTPESADTPCCASCANAALVDSPMEHFVYAIGRLSVRFPTLGLEREFEQRERILERRTKKSTSDRVAAVLSANDHLARAVCFVFTVGGLPSYLVRPTSQAVLGSLIEGLPADEEATAWNLIVGKRGPIASPVDCGGLIAPIVMVDVVYSFTLAEFAGALQEKARPVLAAHNISDELFNTVTTDVIQRMLDSAENIGGLNSHRALNFLLVQHPGLFLAVAERWDKAVLDSLDTRPTESPGGRQIVSVILTFIDRATGVPERLFTRVDVTEEWPFITDTAQTGGTPLGLHPFVGNSLTSPFG